MFTFEVRIFFTLALAKRISHNMYNIDRRDDSGYYCIFDHLGECNKHCQSIGAKGGKCSGFVKKTCNCSYD